MRLSQECVDDAVRAVDEFIDSRPGVVAPRWVGRAMAAGRDRLVARRVAQMVAVARDVLEEHCSPVKPYVYRWRVAFFEGVFWVELSAPRSWSDYFPPLARGAFASLEAITPPNTASFFERLERQISADIHFVLDEAQMASFSALWRA